MYFRWISTHFLPDPHNVWQTSINWFVSRIFSKIILLSFLYYPFGIFFYKRFSHNKKKTFVEEYTIPNHIAKKLLSGKNRHNLISSTNTPSFINFAKRGLSFLVLYEIGSTKHKKPLADIYTSQIHVIWDKKSSSFYHAKVLPDSNNSKILSR